VGAATLDARREFPLQLPLAIASLLLALPGHAAEREWIPYRKLVDVIKLDKFSALPPAERDKVVLYAKLVPVNKAISPLDAGLVVVDGANRTPMPLDAGGRAHMVLDPQWLAHDAQIWTSLPKGEKVRMGFDLGAVLPESTQWRYAAVMGALPQTNAAIGKVAGALSLQVRQAGPADHQDRQRRQALRQRCPEPGHAQVRRGHAEGKSAGGMVDAAVRGGNDD
jgi:hypothetical protein